MIKIDTRYNEANEIVKREFFALEEELAALRADIESHEQADTNFKQTLVTAFRLANKASELFEISKINEKRELINFLFSKLLLRGRKLEYTLRKPFA